MQFPAAVAVFLVIAAVLCAACLQPTGPAAGPQNVSKTIRISGAFALYPMMIAWSDEYRKIHPDVIFEISAGGAGKGMTDTLSGMVDIGMISREISPAEIGQGARPVAVARDAVVGTISAKNPAAPAIARRGMTARELREIFIYGNVTDWAGLAPAQGPVPLRMYTRSDACGAGDVWSRFLGNYTQEDLRGTGVYGDPGIVEALKGDPGGIGYNNINFAYDPVSGVPVLGIAVIPLDLNGNGRIDADEDFYGTRNDLIRAIAENRYPSPPARLLYLTARGPFTGETREFVRWILADGQNLTGPSGYLPVDPALAQQGLAALG